MLQHFYYKNPVLFIATENFPGSENIQARPLPNTPANHGTGTTDINKWNSDEDVSTEEISDSAELFVVLYDFSGSGENQFNC